MRQKQRVQRSETGAAPQQLTLSAFPAIGKDTMTANFHEKTGLVALRRWHAGLTHGEATVLRAEAFLEDPKPADSVADIYGRVVDRMSQVEQMHPEAEAVRVEIRADD